MAKLPQDEEIVKACNEQSHVDGSGYGNRCAVYPLSAPQLFIKYGYDDDGISEEARNQRFAYEALRGMPKQDTAGIRIPTIYHVFSSNKKEYIVMEYVQGKTIRQLLDKESVDTRLQECYTQVAQAIKLFLSIPILTAIPGPVGGGIIRHPLFKDTIASVEYSSVAHLQAHLNTVINQTNNNHLHIDFSKETMCFCFSDLYEGNFIYTESGELYIVDFEHVSLVPTSFMTYALNQPRRVCSGIKHQFDLPQDNLEALRVVGHYFMISSRRIGLATTLSLSASRGKR